VPLRTCCWCRYYGGNEFIDQAERLCQVRASLAAAAGFCQQRGPACWLASEGGASCSNWAAADTTRGLVTHHSRVLPPCRSARWRRSTWTLQSGASTCSRYRARPQTSRCAVAVAERVGVARTLALAAALKAVGQANSARTCACILHPTAGVHRVASAARSHHGPGPPPRRPPEPRLPDRHQEDQRHLNLL
jgi:hypothetical protein